MANEPITLTKLMGKPDFVPEKRMEANAEKIILAHLQKRRQADDLFPITADDLTTLIEDYVSDLNVYDELSEFGAGVEGVTLFVPGSKPTVRICPSLSEASNQNRYRSTLAHEFGHVVLHDPMFQAKNGQGLFPPGQPAFQVSFRDGEASESKSDLYEWQAWYFCRSLLMPSSEVRRLIATLRGDWLSDIWVQSDLGYAVIRAASARFGVSEALARIQLVKSGALSETEPAPSLF